MNTPETSISPRQRGILVLMLVIFGAANTIILKLQNVQQVSPGHSFFHPYIQGCAMFLGEALCIVVYWVKSCRPRRRQDERRSLLVLETKPRVPTYLIAVPAFLDFVASNLSYVGLTLISSSVWQISKGGVIVMVAIFSRIFLKKKYGQVKIAGCLFAIIGITMVQVVDVLYSSEDESSHSSSDTVIGLLTVAVSLIFTGMQFVYEEYMFRCYDVDVFEMVGFEGIFGLIFNVALVAGFSYTKCPSWIKCGGGEYVESVSMYFQQLRDNALLMGLCIAEVFSMAISVSIAVTITKKISATSRALADITRTFVIWGFGLVLTATVANKIYHYESLNLLENLLQLVGFIVVVTGTLLYHDLIPCVRQKQDVEDDLIKSLITTTDYRKSQVITSRESLT